MQVFNFREKTPKAQPTVVTIGNFDGIHLGHQALIREVVGEANRRGCTSALVTFNPHPQEVIHPRRPVPRICTPDLQLRLLRESGLDELHVIPFTPELSELEPEAFALRFLIRRFILEKLIIGYDFRFGKHRKGDFILLESLGREHGFALDEIAPVRKMERIVSSTLIRQMIQAHQFSEVPYFLGRPYSLLGRVEKGEQRGRLLGYPTANLIPENSLPLSNGVYITKIGIGSQTCYGVTNIGKRPTFGENEIRVETWIFNMDRDLYGEQIEIWPLQLLRAEMEFSGMQELKAQIAVDTELARTYLIENGHFPETAGNPC